MAKTYLDKSQPQESRQCDKTGASFYRLATPLSAKIEAHSGKVSLFLIFAAIWMVGLIGITVANIATGEKFETAAIVVCSIFAVCTAGFLVYGIIDQKRLLAANKEEFKFLSNCVCTDGRVNKCLCSTRRTRGNGSETVRYDITLTYSYTDLAGKTVTGEHKATYAADPEFYNGQYLIIAFCGDQSRILSRFKFKREDEREFLKNETARSDDDFDGLDGKLLKCEPKRKVRSAELPNVWGWAALALFIFVAAFTIPISVFVVPQLVGGPVVPAVIGICMIYLMPTVLMAVICYFLSRFFKGRNKFNRILKNQPKFTNGKIFASEKTYRGGAGKRVYYCYIDVDGKKHTKALNTPYYRKTLQGQALSAIIVYDKYGNSVPLR